MAGIIFIALSILFLVIIGYSFYKNNEKREFDKAEAEAYYNPTENSEFKLEEIPYNFRNAYTLYFRNKFIFNGAEHYTNWRSHYSSELNSATELAHAQEIVIRIKNRIKESAERYKQRKENTKEYIV